MSRIVNQLNFTYKKDLQFNFVIYLKNVHEMSMLLIKDIIFNVMHVKNVPYKVQSYFCDEEEISVETC